MDISKVLSPDLSPKLIIERLKRQMIKEKLERILEFPKKVDGEVSYTSRFVFYIQEGFLTCIRLGENEKYDVTSIPECHGTILYQWGFDASKEMILVKPCCPSCNPTDLLVRHIRDDGSWEDFTYVPKDKHDEHMYL